MLLTISGSEKVCILFLWKAATSSGLCARDTTPAGCGADKPVIESIRSPAVAVLSLRAMVL